MARCEVCGNDYDKAFSVSMPGGGERTFDSFECAIHALAPTCEHCGVRVIGHGVEAGGSFFCCAHCAGAVGVVGVADRAGAVGQGREPDSAGSGGASPAGCGVVPHCQQDAPSKDAPPEWPENVWSFRSRPDLHPPTVEVTAPARGGVAPGYAFVGTKKGAGQHGTLIADNGGQPVWFRPMPDQGLDPFDFKVQRYRGEPVLTWCESNDLSGHGFGEYVIADGSYREITRVRPDGYRWGDHHEFLITPQNTALLLVYNPVPTDLSPVGGLATGAAWDGIVQEVDFETGEVLFEWRSLDHVAIDESYNRASGEPGEDFCYFHINSIDVDHDGNLLISARNTWTVYKVDRGSGEVIWRLGGKKSDFEMGEGTRFAYQHNARRQPDGSITVYDNDVKLGDDGVKADDERSRGVVLELDEDGMTATLAREYPHPDGRVAITQGNVQMLPNGNALVGWGSEPGFSEFSGDGELLFSAAFPTGDHSYRAYRFPWSGRPDDDPAAAAERGPGDGEVTVYASWNGATEVATWQVLAGPGPDRLEPVGSAQRDGFETAVTVRTAGPYVGVRARDRSGRVLGAAGTVRLES